MNKRRLLSDRDLLGRWGEKRCEKFLKKKGLKKLTRNFSCKAGEIDLIMVAPNGAIVFVEVKTRTDETFEAVESVITFGKKNKLYKTARYFLAVHNIDNRPYRFDFVAIVLGKTGPERIKHYENAFVR
ncbi:MAG: YraN family protein [Planctomycetota bacterium]